MWYIGIPNIAKQPYHRALLCSELKKPLAVAVYVINLTESFVNADVDKWEGDCSRVRERCERKCVFLLFYFLL